MGDCIRKPPRTMLRSEFNRRMAEFRRRMEPQTKYYYDMLAAFMPETIILIGPDQPPIRKREPSPLEETTEKLLDTIARSILRDLGLLPPPTIVDDRDDSPG